VLLSACSSKYGLHTDTTDELQKLQRGYVKAQVIHPSGRYLEPFVLDPLTEDRIAVTIPIQHFYQCPRLVKKYKNVAASWVLAQFIPDQPAQPIVGFADVHSERIQKVPAVF